MSTQLVIKGAQYFTGAEIRIPHFTGEYSMVDCTQYQTKEDILESFGRKYFNENKDDYKEYEGVRYYYAESSLCYPCEMQLISDLSHLEFTEY